MQANHLPKLDQLLKIAFKCDLAYAPNSGHRELGGIVRPYPRLRADLTHILGNRRTEITESNRSPDAIVAENKTQIAKHFTI